MHIAFLISHIAMMFTLIMAGYVQKNFSFVFLPHSIFSLRKFLIFFFFSKKVSTKKVIFSFFVTDLLLNFLHIYFSFFFLIKPREHTRIKLWTISDQLNRNNWTWNGNDEMRKLLEHRMENLLSWKSKRDF